MTYYIISIGHIASLLKKVGLFLNKKRAETPLKVSTLSFQIDFLLNKIIEKMFMIITIPIVT